MRDMIFLIDANSLITPYLRYYPFDFAPGFWRQLEDAISSRRIVVLDLVRQEILKGNDSLKEWMENLGDSECIDHRTPEILSKYSSVLEYVQSNPCYQDAALLEWSKNSIADPWLIAVAATYNYVIVTLEEPNNGLNSIKPSKNAKIPDVAREFGVKTMNLFEMMRELGFKLR